MSEDIRNFRNEIGFRTAARWWLIAILLFLPFQRKLIGVFASWNNGVGAFISYLDEITIAVFLLFSIKEFYKQKGSFDQTLFALLLPILLLSISGFISGSINGNSLIITGLGTIDYVKNFLVIFIYAAFFKDHDDIKKIFRFLLVIAVMLGAVSIIQEVWALFSRYILEKDISDISYLFVKNAMPEISWRYGFYRAPSIIQNANIMAFYSLLIFSIYLFTSKEINFVILISILSGVLLSGSIRGYLAFILVVVLFILKNMRLRYIFVVFIMTLCLVATFRDDDIFKLAYINELTELNNISINDEILTDNDMSFESISNDSFRGYTKKKAKEIWRDYPVFGVGPGMFGGHISVKTHSAIYEEYNLSGMMNYIIKWKGIDQYWPQVLAETGLAGFLNIALLLILMATIFFMESQRTTLIELKDLFAALLVLLAVIFIFTIGSGFNLAPLVFTFFAFTGIALGSRRSFDGKREKN